MFRETYRGLTKYSVSTCAAFVADNLSCCLRKKDRAIKLYTSGQEQIDKRLDVVKLIRTTLEFEILKNLLLSSD